MNAWTRDDLPSEVLCSHMDHDSFLCDEMRDMLAEGLNDHHPKPEQAVCAQSDNDEPMMPRETLQERVATDGKLWSQAYAEGVASAERTCDELRSLIEGQKEHVTEARRERDAAVERAEQAERHLEAAWDEAERGGDFPRPGDLMIRRDRVGGNVRFSVSVQQAQLSGIDWGYWRILGRAAQPAPAVSRADQLRDERDDAVQSCMAVGRERDEWKARAEKAEQEASTWRTSTESAHSDFLQAAHDRDEARARLHQVESRPWGIAMDDNASPVFCPVVTREEAEAELDGIARMGFGVPVVSVEEAVEVLFDLVSGDDPAVHVVRESDVEAQAALRNRFGEFVVNGTVLNVTTAEDCREKAQRHLDAVARCESIARAIEAEQAADPVEELAGQIETAAREAIRKVCVLTGAVAPGLDDGVVEEMLDITSKSRRLAAHLLGQEADR